uniref:Pal1-domain-containing protein n=1 Tax=Caenorhabditis tropicalis TaxID=1561998 RepID=A0A1I7TJC9_9PELO
MNQPPTGRRLSTSWDNEVKASQLAVPRVEQRRNSNTLAQLLECHRQLSLNHEDSHSFDYDNMPRFRPESRRASVGSRRPSVAEMLIDSGVTKASDDCVMVTQTLGTSTTLFFQKNPLVDNLDLRPSAIERGLYNFDDSIKEIPPIKYVGTPRPSIQMSTSPRPSLLAKSSPSIDESDGEITPTLRNLPVRPSIGERGLPAMKFTPVYANGQLHERGRTLHKQPRADPRFDFELDKIIANRRKIVDEEESKRERENQIRPRTPAKNYIQQRPHNFDGRGPYQLTSGNVMEELRNQMEGGEVDRIVKEKKTTTLSPTGVPVQNPNRRSITVEGSLPELLDRPYVRASPGDHGTSPDGKLPSKTVTIRVPEDHSNQPRGHFVHRSPTPSPNNTSNGRREKSASP